MNDFTKSELTYIHDCIDSDIVCFNEPDIAYTVRDKLVVMIKQLERYEKVAAKFKEMRESVNE